jgi:hypothetical protein
LTSRPPDLPRPEEKLREFLEAMPELAHRPVCERHGAKLRAECVEESREVSEFDRYDWVENGEGETEWQVVGEETVEEVVARESVPVWQAVGAMLDWHDGYHRSALRLAYGQESDPTYETLTVDLDNSWMATYQEQERARLKAMERETCGYQACRECDTRWCQEPDEHATESVAGKFEEPVVVLTGRTASGRDMAPADHAREISDTFSYGGVRRSLRYVMDKLGLESGEWVRWTQGEPHTSKRAGDSYGTNTGRHHAHDILIFDESAVSEEVSAGTFREVIETHVAECEGAGREAHDLDVEDWDAAPETAECGCKNGCEECVGTVTVKRVEEEIEESVASYAAAYLANESEDLLERPPEYLAWAATMWATETQKATGTDSRTHAIDADQCKHKYHAEDEDQDLAHGEEVRQERVRGSRRIVCVACGSPWGINQDQTLVSARVGGETAETVEEELRERWPSARSAAVVGGPVSERECGHEEVDTCPLCARETESPEHTVAGTEPVPESASAGSVPSVAVGFERPPSWSADAVIRDGEELPASGGGVDKRPLKLRDAPERVAAMAVRAPAVVKCGCGTTFDEVAAWYDHVRACGAGEVGVGWLPKRSDPRAEPSALAVEEFVDVMPDQYLVGEEPGGGESDGEEEVGGVAREVVKERVEEVVARDPGVGAIEVMGRLGLPPSVREEVEEIVADVCDVSADGY